NGPQQETSLLRFPDAGQNILEPQRLTGMLPGKIVFEKAVGNDIENDCDDGKNREHIYLVRGSTHATPTVLFIRRLRLGSLEERDQRDKGSCKTKNSEKMPQLTGQEMFTNIFHVRGINFGSEPSVRNWDRPYTSKDISAGFRPYG